MKGPIACKLCEGTTPLIITTYLSLSWLLEPPFKPHSSFGGVKFITRRVWLAKIVAFFFHH